MNDKFLKADKQREWQERPETYIMYLRMLLMSAAYFYYAKQTPKMTDTEWDMAYHELEDLEEKYPELASPEHNVHKVACGFYE